MGVEGITIYFVPGYGCICGGGDGSEGGIGFDGCLISFSALLKALVVARTLLATF